MSGVFGILDSKQDTNISPILDQMGLRMSHRPWYVVDNQILENNCVGLARIGIGIFNREPQPFFCQSSEIFVFMSGELYNTAPVFSDLLAKGYSFTSNSDLELVLRLYQEKGIQFIDVLEGVFQVAVWDCARQELIIANDRFGLLPLYYAHIQSHFIFAPEVKAVLCDPLVPKHLNLISVAEYVRFQFLLGDKTFFDDIKLLPNASLLRYNFLTDKLSIESYWDLSQIPRLSPNIRFQDAVDEAGRLLQESVNRSTGGDYRFGVYLSGGVDARVILGLLSRDLFPLPTVTFGQRGSRDVVYAQRLASIAGSDHHYFEFVNGSWVKDFAGFHLELTEGFHSWIHSHGISTLKPVRDLFDVNLTGFGGEMPILGWHASALLEAKDDTAFTIHLFNISTQNATWPSIDEVEEKFLYAASYSKKMQNLAFDSFCAELAKFSYLPYKERAYYFVRCNHSLRMDLYHTVFHRSYLEQRFPFFDYRYFEFIHALPLNFVTKRKLRRAIILKMMKSLARVPYDMDQLPISEIKFVEFLAKFVLKSKSFINRNILPVFPEYSPLYADYDDWLRNELYEWGEAILMGKSALHREIFNPEFLRSLWLRHQSGNEVFLIGKIAPIMTLEMVFQKFFE